MLLNHHQLLVKKKETTETIDTRFYRKAEIKDIKIKEVEYILKRCAVDCSLNKNANIHNFKDILNIVTSTGNKIKINIGDIPDSRECNYKKDCNYKCIWEPIQNKKV